MAHACNNASVEKPMRLTYVYVWSLVRRNVRFVIIPSMVVFRRYKKETYFSKYLTK